MALLTKDFDFHLPEELIADRPLSDRAASRMLVINRKEGTFDHRWFKDFPQYLKSDDLLVLNNTRVIPARVWSDDQKIELLCLDRLSPLDWRCLVRPGKKMKLGHSVTVGDITGTVTEVFENGDRLIHWQKPLDLHSHGQLALPHYMGRLSDEADAERYQTVYAKEEGAIAAPTAGLHFTPEILAKIPHSFLTLHVGVGTFRPVSAERIEDHEMHSEKFIVPQDTAENINRAKRVIAVGTTVTRVLESIALSHPSESERIANTRHEGATDIFIHPPYAFKAIDGLLTNFHLPQSTLLMLVCALAGKELALKAYQSAVENRYRFYSYGDCMLIL